MSQVLPTVRIESPPDSEANPTRRHKTIHAEVVDTAGRTDQTPATLSDALIRLAEAEDTLRAIGAGEIDAFVVADGGTGHSVFTLSTADRPYRMFVEKMRDGAATLSSSGLILWANPRLAELLSCPRETIVGSSLALFVEGDVPVWQEEIRDTGGVGATLEIVLVDATGVIVPVLVGYSPLDVDGEQLTCLTFTDLSAKKAQEREIARLDRAQAERMADLQDAQAALTKQATHDALTGLPNRALLVDRIDQALLQSKRSGRYTAVLFIDLDRFKQVNDTHGHAVGDTVLQKTAERLSAVLRSMDTVARIGGDEFVVLAPDLDSHEHAVAMGKRLVTEFNRRPDRVDDSERVTASIGVSVSFAGLGTAETLLNEADLAMYQAKSFGGRRVEVFDATLGHQIQERVSARQMLKSALDEGRVIAYYQPIVELSSGSITGFEALARIVEHDGRVLPPAAFITVAEDTGLVVPLGTQVLELACREANSWQSGALADRGLTVAVNLSSRQFEPDDLSEVLGRILDETGMDPERLHLEITETAIMNLRPDILKQLGDIRDLGVQIGLDDFGTGYASLTHLRRLPLSFVKIDQSFVQGLGTDQEDERIVSAVVELAANLGLRSIAEGIETKDQLDRLRGLGCDQAQGYLFARPLPPNEIPAAVQDFAWREFFGEN